MPLEQLFTREQHSWELGIWIGEHSCSILGVFVTWGVSPLELVALQLPVLWHPARTTCTPSVSRCPAPCQGQGGVEMAQERALGWRERCLSCPDGFGE